MATAIALTRVDSKYADKKKEQVKGIATGAGAIDHTITPALAFKLVKLELHLSAAPTTSQNFVVKNDAGDGTAYDTVLLSRDLTVGSIADLLWQPEGGHDLFESDDVIAITWTNTDAKTWALRAVCELK